MEFRSQLSSERSPGSARQSARLTTKFQRVQVGRCHVQTATDRFGDGAKVAIRHREHHSTGPQLPIGELPILWPTLDSDDEDQSTRSIYKVIPACQSFRNNLTALSSSYNLYFAAYQGRVFVYRLRTAPNHSISQRPDLQLAPRPSEMGRTFGGALDRNRGFIINHLIIGFLGEEEIVVFCCDNGDVCAYYTSQVNSTISGRHDEMPHATSKLRPFFRDNVGISAWGLAVHPQSRLVAVSSNRHEVTVFAFALSANRSSRQAPISDKDRETNVRRRARNWRIVVLLGEGAENVPNICFMDDKQGEAEKICAIDIKGTVWIADIWKMAQPVIHLPLVLKPPVRSEEWFPNISRGWGILALPVESFLPVETEDELYGMPIERVDIKTHRGAPFANIKWCLRYLPGNPCSEPSLRTTRAVVQNFPANLTGDQAWDILLELNDQPWLADLDAGDDSEESEGEAVATEENAEVLPIEDSSDDDHVSVATNAALIPSQNAPSGQGSNVEALENTMAILNEAVLELEDAYKTYTNTLLTPTAGDYLSFPSQQESEAELSRLKPDDAYPSRSDMIYFPHNGQIRDVPQDNEKLKKFLERSEADSPCKKRDGKPLERLAGRYYIFRTLEKDVELKGFGRDVRTGAKELSVACPDLTYFGRFREHGIRNHFHATSRLNMVVHVPEPSVVIAGSPTGRVVIITPTKMRQPVMVGDTKHEYGFRVEWILPTKDEEQTLQRIQRPLHGIAVGPIHAAEGANDDRPELPTRFRLMLHYRSHDILSYEITRHEQTGKVCIF